MHKQKNSNDMRQPNSFQEQRQGTISHPKEEKDMRQPNSFQEQPSKQEKDQTKI